MHPLSVHHFILYFDTFQSELQTLSLCTCNKRTLKTFEIKCFSFKFSKCAIETFSNSHCHIKQLKNEITVFYSSSVIELNFSVNS